MQDFLSKELPLMLITILISVLSVILLIRFVPAFQPKASVVSFDVLKLANAQRKLSLASSLDPNTDILIQLRRVGSKTQQIISEVAGPNTIVVVKQAVVSRANVPDITDEVLKKLDLPTNVQSADYDTPSQLNGLPNPAKIASKLDSLLVKPEETANKDSGIIPE